MAFIRIKRIKNIEYAYLVKNKWTKKGARQKVGKYLGKVIRFENCPTSCFCAENIEELLNKPNKDILNTLIEFELKQIGFEKNNNDLIKDKIIYNAKNHAISSENKPVALFLNDGYFCNETLKELFGFNFKGDETEVATELANAFVNCGLKIPEDVFILFFKKIYKENTVTRID